MGNGPAFAPQTLKEYVAQMRLIPGGTFTMGDDRSKYKPEKPAHSITLSPFQMGATPVTVGMWMEYCYQVGVPMPYPPEWEWKPNHPMVRVSYDDVVGEEGAEGYCEWASRQVGVRLRLPTEAQFEYCARDGGKDIAYPWGDQFDASLLWCSVQEQGDARRTSPVVRAERIHVNSLGLSDMAGNVGQWCSDWYGDYRGVNLVDSRAGLVGMFRKKRTILTASSEPLLDPTGLPQGDNRCVRGGSWFFILPSVFRCAARLKDIPVYRSINVGFRLAADPE